MPGMGRKKRLLSREARSKLERLYPVKAGASV
jgi:hypothetical protein